ncbi:hypothetical protein [Kitasatospora sp. NBC_01300]|uniref:hypothetical protein n=1 Tax=Kitasatospora sp. NBC_01300 TaxID=2903574 RepID=UPI002F918461|nr:hypothetical protein OG556_39380 [Kitasatospora sp. NBC_01300]
MSTVVHVRRTRRAIAVAAALGVAAVCGSVVAAAPVAFAGEPSHTALSVQAPTSVGFAGGPVEFTEDITNSGQESTGYHLELQTVTAVGTPPDAIVIDYRDPADGTWKSVPLVMTGTSGGVVYDGTVSGLTVPAGRTLRVDLRIGAPMGLPHDGATNGGFQSIALHPAVVADPHEPAQAEVTSTIKVTSITSSLDHVPATVVAGGTPVEFDATLDNPTPSDYTNLGNVLFVDRHATVQVRTADGAWRTLDKVAGIAPDDPFGVYLQGRDSSLRSGAKAVARVRVSYDAKTPAGTTTLGPCVFVNEGQPFRGTTKCGTHSTIQVLPAATKAPEPSPSSSAPSAPVSSAPSAPAGAAVPVSASSPSAPSTPAPADPSTTSTAPSTPQARAAEAAQPAAPSSVQLASTGADHSAGLAFGGLALTAAGACALWLRRVLRRA